MSRSYRIPPLPPSASMACSGIALPLLVSEKSTNLFENYYYLAALITVNNLNKGHVTKNKFVYE
jgi:hypothetical protein